MNKNVAKNFTMTTLDPELYAIVNYAYDNSPIVREALWQQQNYYAQVQADQQALLAQNKVLWTAQPQRDLPTLQSKVVERLDTDLVFVQKMNAALEVGLAPGEEGFTWSLSTNKMTDILSQAKNIVLDETLLMQIAQGEVPAAYYNTPPFPVVLGDVDATYGNSKITYFSAAILTVNLVLGDTEKVQNININDTENWLDEAAISHITPIPAAVDVNAIDMNFTTDFSYYYSDEHTPQGLVFVHSGYAFGGQRGEDRYSQGKEFGPEDCSSWIAKIAQAEISFSTIDQLFTYRMSLPENERPYVDAQWLESEYVKTMDVLAPVHILDPQFDIKPGQIYAFRDFGTEDHDTTAGKSGHTALVLGLRENGNVVTLGYARDMPEMEGFGIKEFPWAASENRETLFFEVKPTYLTADEILESAPNIPGLGSANNESNRIETAMPVNYFQPQGVEACLTVEPILVVA